MNSSNLWKLVIMVVVSELAGVIGGFFTAPAIPEWYMYIAKPAFTPPSWVFAPVWTTLFALMGVAAFLIWKHGTKIKNIRIALYLFFFQLGLNVLWSVLFFGLRAPGWALFEIGVLWVTIVATLIAFFRVSRTAAILFIPYLLWVSFAAYLNYSLWILNR